MKHLLLYEEWCAAGTLPQPALSESENWDWSLSDVLHLVADVTACIADCVVPGSGFVIDLGSLISYIIEAGLEYKDKGFSNKFLMLAINGLLQFTMLFDPFNIGTFLKNQIREVFHFFSKPSQAGWKAMGGEFAIQALMESVNNLIGKISQLLGKLIKGISESWIGKKVAEFAARLGEADFIKWLSKFFLETIPSAVKKFLEKLAALNPNGIGVSGISKPNIVKGLDLSKKIAAGETEELFGKTFGKFVTGQTLGQTSKALLDEMSAWKEFFKGKPSVDSKDNSENANEIVTQLLKIPGSKRAKTYEAGSTPPTKFNTVCIYISEVQRAYYFNCTDFELNVFNVSVQDWNRSNTFNNSDANVAYVGTFKLNQGLINTTGTTRENKSVSEKIDSDGKLKSTNLPLSK